MLNTSAPIIDHLSQENPYPMEARTPRRACVLAAVVAALIVASPASASTFCVHRSGCHGAQKSSVSAAVRAAAANGAGRDLILVGPGRFRGSWAKAQGDPFEDRPANVFTLSGEGRRTTIVNDGRNKTDCAFSVAHAGAIRRLHLAGDCLDLTGSADHVATDNTVELNGGRFIRGTIRTPGHTAARQVGTSSLVSDSRLVGSVGVQGCFYASSSCGGSVRVRRTRISTTHIGLVDVREVSDSLIVVHGRGQGILASCGTPVSATNVTLIGTGAAGSIGARTQTSPEFAPPSSKRGIRTGGPGYCQTASLRLRNSIVRGFAVSLREDRGGPCPATSHTVADCPAGSRHSDNVLAASYSDYDPSRVQNDRPVSVDFGHNVNVDPRFMFAAGGEFRLRYDSPLIDRGAGRARGQRDLGGHRRSVDAHRAGSGIVDMGAFEYQGTGPRPVIGARRTARVGQRVALRGDRSSDPDGGRLNYNWHFGDRSASRDGMWVTHTFRHPGRFRVYLRVTDFAGQQAFTSRAIRITR